MKPCGIILTYMSREDFKGKSFWVKVRTLFFNCKLFTFQLIFMVVGKILGKVKVKWRQIWRAAQCSHVRLCLRQSGLKSSEEWAKIHKDNVHVLDPDGWDRANFQQSWGEKITEAEFRKRCSASTAEWNDDFYWFNPEQAPMYDYMNFGWEFAEIQPWRLDQCKGQFEYRDPTFDTSPAFIAAMIEYAEAQVGKRYDWLQLILGYPVNFIVWLFCPWWWGKEKIRWFNLRGGAEVCSSGWVADLRWAEQYHIGKVKEITGSPGSYVIQYDADFIPGYDTAVIPPCLAPLSENWREG